MAGAAFAFSGGDLLLDLVVDALRDMAHRKVVGLDRAITRDFALAIAAGGEREAGRRHCDRAGLRLALGECSAGGEEGDEKERREGVHGENPDAGVESPRNTTRGRKVRQAMVFTRRSHKRSGGRGLD